MQFLFGAGLVHAAALVAIAAEPERDSEAVDRLVFQVLEDVVDADVLPGHAQARGQRAAIQARAHRKSRQQTDLDAGVQVRVHVLRLLEVHRAQDPAVASDRVPVGGARAQARRVGNRFLVQAQRGLDRVAQRGAHGEVLGPGLMRAEGQGRSRYHAEIQAQARVLIAGQAVAAQFQRAAERPDGTHLAAVGHGDLGLGVRQIVGQKQVAVVALLDPVDAEAAEGERADAPAPARQYERGVLFAEAQTDQVRVRGLELAALHEAQAAGIPDHGAGVVGDRDVGAAEGQGAVAGAVGEDRADAVVVAGGRRRGNSESPDCQGGQQQDGDAVQFLHRTTATFLR